MLNDKTMVQGATVYHDGQPVGVDKLDLPQIEMADQEERDLCGALAAPAAGTITLNITPERLTAATEGLKMIWAAMLAEVERAAAAFVKMWPEMWEVEERRRALRWAEVYKPRWAHIYHHTKKGRTRKKYIKRIVAWYREEVLGP